MYFINAPATIEIYNIKILKLILGKKLYCIIQNSICVVLKNVCYNNNKCLQAQNLRSVMVSLKVNYSMIIGISLSI